MKQSHSVLITTLKGVGITKEVIQSMIGRELTNHNINDLLKFIKYPKSDRFIPVLSVISVSVKAIKSYNIPIIIKDLNNKTLVFNSLHSDWVDYRSGLLIFNIVLETFNKDQITMSSLMEIYKSISKEYIACYLYYEDLKMLETCYLKISDIKLPERLELLPSNNTIENVITIKDDKNSIDFELDYYLDKIEVDLLNQIKVNDK